MKLGVISDIHGNDVALNSVLSDMPKVDKKICCGDIVGYGPSPERCLDTIRDEFDIIVMGNHDRNVATKDLEDMNLMSEDYAKRVLSNKKLRWLRSLPDEYNSDIMKVVHSHPTRKGTYVEPRDFPRMKKYLNGEKILLMGHTHKVHSYKSDVLIANPGSVGQPRDGNVYSSYMIIETDPLEAEVRRVEYDINKVKQRIVNLGFPRDNYRRLFEGR